MTTIYRGKHWRTGQGVELEVNGDLITGCRETQYEGTAWIGPGLIDIQVNGIGGFNLNDGNCSLETLQNIVGVLHRYGVTRFCPTIITGEYELMLHGIQTVAHACREDLQVRNAVLGIHVEGPYISSEDGPRGAHKKEWVRNPDWKEYMAWQEAAEGRICKVTLAPELPGAIDFIRRLAKEGVVPAIGHSAATEQEIRQAVEAGARMSTHLGNGSHLMLPRHPNYIWAQLAEDRMWAGLIGDGFHLPLSTLKSMLRAKGRKAIITSDASYLAGMPAGTYDSHNGKVVLEPNGHLHLADSPGILAGSALPLSTALAVMSSHGICTLGESIDMASLHPAELFGLDRTGAGGLEIGSPADMIVYTSNDNSIFRIDKTISRGNVVYDREAEQAVRPT
ncbi:N-acetylglucosamine-6-phosphate deacetylase [Paenibacillus koleovorans]|uniref:N-acetylglucosamine-6-phosphate deacetylase n=1 Tax=Paenibacillus koleovorans TaxID=121608 RepID=UPI000FDB83F0|nr:amidohydrolase family protein [Paenibacillus koleovorans]